MRCVSTALAISLIQLELSINSDFMFELHDIMLFQKEPVHQYVCYYLPFSIIQLNSTSPLIYHCSTKSIIYILVRKL
ncbi:unnamed protein product [Paramecium octaurelia]|uniref:Uncharacterized protein n=1 Tax=Paramecium octaurelia TaxID=43137 RepID=A0A8S1WJ26_PAROT|nr:unnamed protein product [Paramecium octaurelia]